MSYTFPIDLGPVNPVQPSPPSWPDQPFAYPDNARGVQDPVQVLSVLAIGYQPNPTAPPADAQQ